MVNTSALPSLKVNPLSRQSLAERLADELRNLILLEKLAPGATIPERETATALGVSRTPLRESLRILATEGLVNIEPNRAPKVANPSLEELGDLLEVLGTLESLAGELACSNATDSQIKEIATVESRMRKLSDSSNESVQALKFFELDMRFHRLIVEAAGNEPLAQTHNTYNCRLWRGRFVSSRQGANRPRTLKQHAAIVEALVNRDKAACSVALKKHLDTGLENIVKAIKMQESGNEV